MVYYLKVCFPALWNVEGFEVVKRSSKIRTVDSDETKLQTLGKTSLLNDSLFCCVINIASLKDRKEAPWVEGGGLSQPSQDFSIQLCWVVLYESVIFLWNVAHRDEEEPFVCAIHNFDQFCPNEEVTLFWKRARFLSQVLVHCTQYPSLCSFTRALLSTSAISGLCASSFKQFILLCPSWQKVKDLFENKKKLSSFGGNVLQGVLRILALRKRI